MCLHTQLPAYLGAYSDFRRGSSLTLLNSVGSAKTMVTFEVRLNAFYIMRLPGTYETWEERHGLKVMWLAVQVTGGRAVMVKVVNLARS